MTPPVLPLPSSSWPWEQLWDGHGINLDGSCCSGEPFQALSAQQATVVWCHHCLTWGVWMSEASDSIFMPTRHLHLRYLYIESKFSSQCSRVISFSSPFCLLDLRFNLILSTLLELPCFVPESSLGRIHTRADGKEKIKLKLIKFSISN